MPPGRYVSGVTEMPVGEVTVVGVCVPWQNSRVANEDSARRRKPWEDHERYLERLRSVLAQAPSERLVVTGDFNQKIEEPGGRQRGWTGATRHRHKAAETAGHGQGMAEEKPDVDTQKFCPFLNTQQFCPDRTTLGRLHKRRRARSVGMIRRTEDRNKPKFHNNRILIHVQFTNDSVELQKRFGHAASACGRGSG